MQIAEFYCGVGGFAAAWDVRQFGPAHFTALDIDRLALSIYAANFPLHQVVCAELESYATQGLDADLWWLSPPCLPFTQKGKQRDWDDPRTRSLIALIHQASRHRPQALLIENVPPFQTSVTGDWAVTQLEQCGYQCVWELRCPSDLGIPMRRRRCYLIASRQPLRPLPQPDVSEHAISDYLDAQPEPGTWVEEKLLARYAGALSVIARDDPGAVAACFASGYGRSPVRCGSYLRDGEERVRRFSPREILRLLGFPEGYKLPTDLPVTSAYRLLGNSLSVPVVRWVLQRLGPFETEAGSR